MKVLIIGAAGMIGARLAARIAADGRIGERDVSELDLADVVEPQRPFGTLDRVETRALDISAPGAASPLIANRPDVIFHLAAIVSGEAEADFDKGYRINLDGTRGLFDAVRAAHDEDGYTPRLVFASSIAVFGAPFPADRKSVV